MKHRISIAVALFNVTALFVAVDSVSAAGCPGSGQQSVGPDVVVGTLGQIQTSQQITNYTGTGGLDAFSVGTTSCNLGDTVLLWQASNDPDHPVIGQNLFRLKQINGAWRFEQLGQSWLKHGFTALSQNACCASCCCGGGSTLGIGCSDPYTASRNGGQSGAGPKWQVNATTGVHQQPRANPAWSGSMARRLQVKIEDLEASTTVNAPTKYWIEGQYIAADDAAAGHKNNNASYRRLSVSGSGSDFTFGYFGTDPNIETQRQQPGIRAWQDTDPTVVETDIVTPEDANPDPDVTIALVILAAQATDLGNGTWHYEYALQNLNSDRSIYSFSVPADAGVTITNIGFRDVDYHSNDGINSVNTDGTDWPGVRNANNVTWACAHTHAQNPNANALRWGTMYNFRFDANVPPTTGNVTLVQFKPGAQTLTASTVVPNFVPCQAPSIASIPGQASVCSVPYAYTPSATGTPPLSWSLAGAPAGMTIDSNGEIAWPSPVASPTAYNFNVTAASTCGPGSDTKPVVLKVLPGDFTGDGKVTLADLDAFTEHLVENAAVSTCAADVNLDESVDGHDVDAFLQMLGL